MTNQTTVSPICASYQAALPAYVRRELANEPVTQLYPELTEHLENCPICEPLYYREFRVQGLRKPLAELQQVGNRASVAGVMEQILRPVIPSSRVEPLAEWRQVALEYGRGWVDRVTGAWHQVEIALSNLGNQEGMTPARAGLMSMQVESEAAAGDVLSLVPEGANFELRVAVMPTPADEHLCDLEVTLTLYERFGNYSGVEVTLLHDTIVQSGITDALGKVSFANVPSVQVNAMHLTVRMPES